MSYTRTSSTQKSTVISPTQVIEDSKKRQSLLKDSSWIKKDIDEDEPVDRDPNYAKSILGHYNPSDTVEGSEPTEVKSQKTSSLPSTVKALTKRFSQSQESLDQPSNTLQSTPTRTSYTMSTTSTVLESDPTQNTTTTSATKDDKMMTKTTTKTTSKTPTDSFTAKVFADGASKGTPYSSYTAVTTRTTKVTKTTDVISSTKKETTLTKSGNVTVDSSKGVGITTTTTTRTSSGSEDKSFALPDSLKDDNKASDREDIKTTTTTRTSSTAEDELYGSLLPKSLTDISSGRTSLTKTSDVTVDSSKGPGIITTTTTRRSTSAVDDLYDTLVSGVSAPYTKRENTKDSSYRTYSSTSVDGPSTPTSYSSSSAPRYEYTSVSSPTGFSPSYKDIRSDDYLSDTFVSRSPTRTVYSTPERPVLEKDLCSYCRKPFNTDAKMVLEDMKINCHASCFKCQVCSNSLGHLKAGDVLWVYRRTVHCERCFDNKRDQWRR